MSQRIHVGLNTQIYFKGRTATLRDWAESIGLAPKVLAQRINRYHWTVREALTTNKMTPSQRGRLGALKSYWRKLPVGRASG